MQYHVALADLWYGLFFSFFQAMKTQWYDIKYEIKSFYSFLLIWLNLLLCVCILRFSMTSFFFLFLQ